jgi:hypothetical protein
MDQSTHRILLDAKPYTVKDRCTAAHAPSNDNPEKFSKSARLTAIQEMELAHVYSPHMLAHDRRIFDKTLVEQLRLRTSDISAWTTTMYPIIHQSVRDAKTQTNTSHQDNRTYLTGTASTAPNTNTTTNAKKNHRPPPGRTPEPQQQQIWPRLHRTHPEFDSDLSPQCAVAYSNQDLTLPRQIH